MSQNTNKQHREIKVVVRDFTQQGERDKVRDELIKSGYKVVVIKILQRKRVIGEISNV